MLDPIVAVALVDSLASPARLFAASRAYPESLRGQFELPGGKVEVGEDPLVALEREVMEELGVSICVGAPIVQEDGSWWPLANGRLMGVWLGEVSDGVLRVGEAHLEGVWLPLSDEALAVPWIEADVPIVRAIVAHAHQCSDQ